MSVRTSTLENMYTYIHVSFLLQYRRDFAVGGFKIVEMMFKSNIVALVGGGEIPKYPPNKVMLWDDHQGRAIGELSHTTAVRSVKMRRDRISVCLDDKVLVYNLEDLKLVHEARTVPNPLGLLAMSSSSDDATVIAHPGEAIGQVRVDALDSKRTRMIQAHNRNIAAIAITEHGKYIATASEKGTLIRIFSTQDGSKIREVRRGTDPATIFSLAFSFEQGMPHWLASTSDKGTLHIFELRADEEDADEEGFQLIRDNVPSVSQPRGPWRGLWKSMLPKAGTSYLASERSWSQFHLPDTSTCIVSFDKTYDGLVNVISHTGVIHTVEFRVDAKSPAQSVAHSFFIGDDHVIRLDE